MKFAFLVVLVLLAVFSVAQSTPFIEYTQGGDRQLIFVNNPEQIILSDLGDANQGDVSIMRATGITGKVRNWWEHTNRTGRTIGYAVMIYNPNSTSVTISLKGSGWVTGFLGGQPFSDMFNAYSAAGTNTVVPAGGVFWLYRRNESVSNTAFFSGVVDFDVIGGAVTVDNIAYDTFSALDGSRAYQGYIQRIEPDGTHCARQYKGISPYSEVTLDGLHFTIGTIDAGLRNVRYANHDLTGRADTAAITRNYWFTNIGPGQNAQAATSDMVSWFMPGWGQIDPLLRSDGEGKYPNFGNWGVTYVLRGSFINNGLVTRTATLNLQAPSGGGSPIAYLGSDGVWRHTKIDAGANFAYFTATMLPAQTVPFEARYILGGPGAGSLRNTISVQ